ncbi:MAG: serine/threonine-protein kinase, partial [Flavobacteriia bacterium]
MIGKQIQNYKILKLLGEGGMAFVYLAENQVLGNKVAMKILKEDFVRNQNIRKRFIAEGMNLVNMAHPNIVKVVDLIDAGDIVALVLEYIDGITLSEYISQKGKLSDLEIQSLFGEMLKAVKYIHSQGIIHRDVKPSNFMISNNNEIKLLDFGIAKNTNESGNDYTSTGLNQQMGTPNYMSPEQVRGGEITAKTDIYSLGVVLWYLVMGKSVYATSEISFFDLQLKIVQEPLPPTNTKWDKIIEKATQKEESKRFKNVEEFIKEIDNVNIVEYDSEKTIIFENKDSKIEKNYVGHLKKVKFKKRHLFITLILIIIFLLVYRFLYK